MVKLQRHDGAPQAVLGQPDLLLLGGLETAPLRNHSFCFFNSRIKVDFMKGEGLAKLHVFSLPLLYNRTNVLIKDCWHARRHTVCSGTLR